MKTKLGPVNSLYPLPVTLVGATVGGRPNFITIAHVGIMDPGSVSLGMHKSHYTNAGIRDNRTFSVCLPQQDLVRETDYCGMASGRNHDKAALFSVFYGDLETAPMIRECPLCMECRLVQTVDFPKHDIFIGEVVQTHCDEACLTDGVPDFAKIRPMLFTMGDKGYWRLGERFADAWRAGQEIKNK